MLASEYFATLVLQPIKDWAIELLSHLYKSESQLGMDSKLRNQANATIFIQNSSQVEHFAIVSSTASWL